MKKIFLFVPFLFIIGCASVGDVSTLRTEINQLKRDTYELQKQASDLKINKDESFIAMRESGATLRSEVSSISKDLQTLTGRFDENKYNMDNSLKKMTSEIEVLRAQITTLENQLKEVQPKSPSKGKAEISEEKKADGEETASTETKIADTKEPGKLYESAYTLYKEKKYKESRSKFETFIKQYPKDKLSANAQFWIAETLYAEEDYAGAIVEYDVLIKKYPKSDKAPGAMLKQGLGFLEMGDKKAAKGIFEQLRTKYPKAKEAGIAKKKLDEINKPSAKKSR